MFFDSDTPEKIQRTLSGMDRWLLGGIIAFVSGVATLVIIGTYLNVLNSDEPGTAPFPPGAFVTDTCTITPDIGYLSLKVHFSEKGAIRDISAPFNAKIVGPDGTTMLNKNYDRAINFFFGRESPGVYTVTIANLDDQSGSSSEQPPTIHYDLVCVTRDEYNLGQNLGGLLVVANFTYIAAVPALIYGIVRQVRVYRKARTPPEQEITSPIGLPWKIGVRTSRKRPTGVTILSILNGIGGILNLSTGLMQLGQASDLVNSPPEAFESFREEVLRNFGSFAESYSSIIILAFSNAAITLGFSAVQMILVYGLMRGKVWAWPFAVILTLIFIGTALPLGYFFAVQGSLGLDIVYAVFGIIIEIIVLYYLFRPHVKSFFGREISRSLNGRQ
ncbi:MAG TPA: hypothetical protein VGA94_04545 [Thermodesulfobacteriota bacterium]